MPRARWIAAAATGFSIGFWVAYGIGHFIARYWGAL